MPGAPIANFYEVKASVTIPSKERDRLQLLKMIRYLGGVKTETGIPTTLTIVTPSFGNISDELVREANSAGVSLYHSNLEVHRGNPRTIRVGQSVLLNSILMPKSYSKIGKIFRKPGSPAALQLY